ncbi:MULTISPECIES: DUF2637 domain-containing protein [unclassified Streptomyces]|uniref:DUF2637 domain-containing protein n=1 Tax=unclassified Streptomyces TaxID=2593676 RepID=UPI002E821693|nr:DUF2637 domain-containing protein [Streptomyces sp. NBC_00589]WTI33548.1 DUF2637 domain-containing protein [Streptomyces sp. NBC_00775]WUB32781.1 DUF2637 domain-containing protein [Streptomyces sp. NBC_00589]
MTKPVRLTRMHRILIGVVVAGALVIAGIGFAGSYAAVRELAIKKGFGNFSYVFPIGIDAGICVLLALDLLLTWIRIPFPLLRQTAWLLTLATIAFNGAAAWPDPLGVGMHAVIPVLFVVSVEAARHAIGRIADITADKHMEGVRLTRWLLSPVPTFLLWRRMKLWELRSYEQVIKLEQDRLVYQARLHSRFGRAWGRKAPVESLMPLRLARYGVPLAETAPSGLAAAGIEPVLVAGASPPTAGGNTPSVKPNPLPSPAHEAASSPQHSHSPTNSRARPAEHHLSLTSPRLPHSPASEHNNPATAGPPHTHGRQTAPAAARALPAQQRPQPRLKEDTFAPIENPREDQQTAQAGELSPVDRYYVAWHDFQQQHQREPDGSELSARLTQDGILDREDQPIKPRTLARYFLQFRIYTTWAQHRTITDNPSIDQLVKELTQRGITAQYNKPIHATDLERHLSSFERRWQALTARQHTY